VIMGVSCLKCGYMMRCHYYIDLRIFGLANSDAEKNCWAVTATVFLPPHFLVLVTRTIASNPIVTICIFLNRTHCYLKVTFFPGEERVYSSSI